MPKEERANKDKNHDNNGNDIHTNTYTEQANNLKRCTDRKNCINH